jgi:DHA1 family inner membrane transport protein
MRAWTTMAALALSAFTYVTVETLPIGLLPQIAGDLGTTVSAIGLLVTAYGLVVVVATIPLTRATRRWSRRRLLGVLLGIFAAGTFLSALAPNYPILLVARIIVALSQAVFWAVVVPAAASLFRREVHSRALGVLYSGTSTAPLLGVPAGTWLGQQAGWRVPFFVLSALGLGILVAILVLMPDVPPGASDADRGTSPDAGRFRMLVLAIALSVTGAFTVFTYVTPFLTDVSGFDDTAIGPILLVRGAAGLTGVLVAGFFAGRRPWLSLIVVTAGQVVALAGQWAFGTDGIAAVLALSAGALFLAGLTAVLGARILELAPGSTDMASAGTSTAFNVGITTGALIGSLLFTSTGVRSTALVGALLTVAALAVVLAEPFFASAARGPMVPSGQA